MQFRLDADEIRLAYNHLIINHLQQTIYFMKKIQELAALFTGVALAATASSCHAPASKGWKSFSGDATIERRVD